MRDVAERIATRLPPETADRIVQITDGKALETLDDDLRPRSNPELPEIAYLLPPDAVSQIARLADRLVGASARIAARSALRWGRNACLEAQEDGARSLIGSRQPDRHAGHRRTDGGRVVAWIRRSRGRKAEPPPAAEPPSRSSPPGQQPQSPPSGGSVPGVHPVYGLRSGMDRATVISRLGPPPKSLTSEKLHTDYSVTIGTGGKSLPDKEFWLYEDTPPGHDTHVVIVGGVLESAEMSARSAVGDQKDSPGSAGTRKSAVRIVKDSISIYASAPVHALKVLGIILLEDTPLVDSARMRAGYEDVRQRSWHGAPLDEGTVPEIFDLLQADLEHDATLPNHVDFMVMSLPDRACAQVASVFDVPGKSYGTAIAYRVWLIDGGRRLAVARSHPRGGRSYAAAAEKAVPKEAGDAGRARPTQVVGGQDGGYATIGEAIRAAAPDSRILVRPGVYHEGIVLDKPLELIGDGSPGDVVIESSDAPALLFQAGTGRVANLTLRGTGGDSRIRTVDIMRGRLELEDCDISSTGSSCVALRNGADPRLRRNRIHDGKQAGVVAYDNGLGTLEDNDIHSNNSSAGVAIAGGANPTVRGNRIHSGGSAGVAVYDQGLGVLEDNDITGNTHAGIEIFTGGNPTVRGNKIRDGKQSGVFVHDQGLGVLEDNDITGNTYGGVTVVTGGNPTVRGNRIRDGKYSGVLVHSQGLGVLEDNDITGNARAGVETRSGGSPTVRGNKIRDGKQSGVFVHDKGLGVLEDNDITGNAKAGVEISTGGNPTVLGNTISRNGGSAIRIYDEGRATISRNRLGGNAGGAWNISSECDPNVAREDNDA
jgi:parallel beta-helix repeat protein